MEWELNTSPLGKWLLFRPNTPLDRMWPDNIILILKLYIKYLIYGENTDSHDSFFYIDSPLVLTKYLGMVRSM